MLDLELFRLFFFSFFSLFSLLELEEANVEKARNDFFLFFFLKSNYLPASGSTSSASSSAILLPYFFLKKIEKWNEWDQNQIELIESNLLLLLFDIIVKLLSIIIDLELGVVINRHNNSLFTFYLNINNRHLAIKQTSFVFFRNIIYLAHHPGCEIEQRTDAREFVRCHNASLVKNQAISQAKKKTHTQFEHIR